ncbi:TTC1-like protein [Mya arenaria]|uniref:TTC1-like protein n=1 Tax=Mya arenaria TaxID=6604 RepID=A0ABY7FIQ1_MYAAR|nr:TTC1-like protein [Mya arenaria]
MEEKSEHRQYQPLHERLNLDSTLGEEAQSGSKDNLGEEHLSEKGCDIRVHDANINNSIDLQETDQENNSDSKPSASNTDNVLYKHSFNSDSSSDPGKNVDNNTCTEHINHTTSSESNSRIVNEDSAEGAEGFKEAYEDIVEQALAGESRDSDESCSDDEYESAEEGEDQPGDTESLRQMEDNLTDEQKQERKEESQVLKDNGNQLFRDGSYKSALRVYSRALRVCPIKFAKDRAILYSNRAACKMKLEMYDECIRDCTKAVDLHPQYLKAFMRRAEMYEKTEKLDEALADYQKILELDPSQHSARAACVIKERNEKLKDEMMGKLKDLGNLVLKPFGLSTNNFKLNQDPNTGGYSVNFVQNADQPQ